VLDLVEHLPDVGGWKLERRCRPDRRELLTDVSTCLGLSRRSQRTANPFGRGHSPLASQPLDVVELVILEEDLQSLGHVAELK